MDPKMIVVVINVMDSMIVVPRTIHAEYQKETVTQMLTALAAWSVERTTVLSLMLASRQRMTVAKNQKV